MVVLNTTEFEGFMQALQQDPSLLNIVVGVLVDTRGACVLVDTRGGCVGVGVLVDTRGACVLVDNRGGQ